MIRMLLVGYIMGIRSERRLCDEVHLNLAYRWFCRLDLTEPVPDHSTFSKNRHGRFRQSDLFRKLFEDVLSRTIAEGLVGGEAFGIDASLIKADANREDGIEPKDWSPEDHASRATEEYLQTLDDAAFGSATPVPPKYISPVDPAARCLSVIASNRLPLTSPSFVAQPHVPVVAFWSSLIDKISISRLAFIFLPLA